MAQIVQRAGNAPLSISFESNIAEVTAGLGRLQWAVPYATATALTRTARDAAAAENQRIKSSFDRPVPMTQRAVRFRAASKTYLTASVYVRDEAARGTPPSKYLLPQVRGGMRTHKRFERALIARGIMRPDEYAVPARGYPLDAYGNLRGSLIVRILSQLQAAEMTAGFMANETARSRKRNRRGRAARYFVPSGRRQERGIGRLPRGIYERRGKSIRGVIMFVSAPSYARRYPFGAAASKTANRVFWGHWLTAFRALAARSS